jgi:hypothetical protein
MDERAVYVAIQAELMCWTMAHRDDPSVSSAQLAGKQTEIALRYGLRTVEYAGLVRRFVGDAAVKAELDRRLDDCLAALRSAGAADAATPDAGTPPNVPPPSPEESGPLPTGG